MKSPRWEIVHTGPAKWHARFVASNGQIVVSSESYKRKRDALRAIELVIGRDLFRIEGDSHVLVPGAGNGGLVWQLIRDVDMRERP